MKERSNLNVTFVVLALDMLRANILLRPFSRGYEIKLEHSTLITYTDYFYSGYKHGVLLLFLVFFFFLSLNVWYVYSSSKMVQAMAPINE